MKKVVIHKAGGYEQLKIQAFPDLKPGPGELVIESQAIGVNYADCCVRWGVYESAKKYVGWPITPGFEVAGRVGAVGEGVTRFKPGDAVFGMVRFNAYATQVLVPEGQVFSLPRGFKPEEAAGFPAVYMTAYHAIHQLVRIRKGGTVLVHSAAGGVGTALLQLCRIEGLKAIAVVGRSHKVETARQFGAWQVIDKSTQDLWAEVDQLAPNGLDAVFDANGAETLKQGYERLAPTGKLLAYGAHTMLPDQGGKLDWIRLIKGYFQLPRFNPLNLMTDNRTISGFNLSFLFERTDLMNEGMQALLRWVEEGRLSPPKTTLFPFEDVAQAHAAIESGKTTGKLILVT